MNKERSMYTHVCVVEGSNIEIAFGGTNVAVILTPADVIDLIEKLRDVYDEIESYNYEDSIE